MPKCPSTLLACLVISAASVTLAAGSGGCKRKEVEGSARAEAKHLFDSICAKCHGADGRGGVPAAEGQPSPRNFCDPAFHTSRSDDELRRVIREGKGPMPPFAALFDEAQTTLLVDYIRHFNPQKKP
jgi:mono/diheme cytochrome c family protein